MEDAEAELRIPELTYDRDNRLFFIMSNKVRVRMIENEENSIERIVEDVRVADKPSKKRTQPKLEEVQEIEDTRIPEGAKIHRVPKRRIKTQVIREHDDVIYREGDDIVAPPPPPPPPRAIPSERTRPSKIDIVEDVEEIEVELEMPEPAPKKNEVFQIVEEAPEFPGGEKAMFAFINKNIRYPEIARENGIEGKVYIRFIVSKDGSIRDVKVLRGIGSGCDEEAMRVVKRMPNWKPGKQRGKAVSVMFNLPFSFKLK